MTALKASTDAYDAMSTESLADHVSDYHKDVHGFRFRSNDRRELLHTLRQLDLDMVIMQSTPVGRAKLQSEGWMVPDFN